MMMVVPVTLYNALFSEETIVFSPLRGKDEQTEAIQKNVLFHIAYNFYCLLPKTTIFCRNGEKEKALKSLNFRALPLFAICFRGAYGTLTYNFTKYHKLVTIY